MYNKFIATGIVAAALVGAAGTAQAGKDLDAIKARGSLLCGVGAGTPAAVTAAASDST